MEIPVFSGCKSWCGTGCSYGKEQIGTHESDIQSLTPAHGKAANRTLSILEPVFFLDSRNESGGQLKDKAVVGGGVEQIERGAFFAGTAYVNIRKNHGVVGQALLYNGANLAVVGE